MASSQPHLAALPPANTAVPGQIFSPTTGHSIDPTGEARGFDFRQFWHALVRKSWIVALFTIGGLLLSIGYLARTPKLYQGRVILEIDVQDPTPIRSEDSSSRMRTMFLASQEAMRTIESRGACPVASTTRHVPSIAASATA